MNTRNFGIVEGRLTRDIAVFENADTSHKVMMTIAVQDNYKSKDGKRASQFVSVEGFVPAGKNLGVYKHIAKGDMVGIEYTVKSNNYKDPKTGEPVYSQILFIQSVDLKETQDSKKNRAEKAAANAAAPATETPAEAPAPADDDMPFAE